MKFFCGCYKPGAKWSRGFLIILKSLEMSQLIQNPLKEVKQNSTGQIYTIDSVDSTTDLYIKEGVFGVMFYLYMRREVNPTSLFGYTADNPSEDI